MARARVPSSLPGVEEGKARDGRSSSARDHSDLLAVRIRVEVATEDKGNARVLKLAEEVEDLAYGVLPRSALIEPPGFRAAARAIEMQTNVDHVDGDARRFYERHRITNIEPGEDYRMLCYIVEPWPQRGGPSAPSTVVTPS